MIGESMDENLRDYFIWASQQDPADLGFPHQTPFRRLLGTSVRSIGLSDEDAMEINRALCMLWHDDPECFDIIRLYYQDRRSFRWMERHGRGERKALARRLADGLQFLRGVMCASVA